MIRLERTSVMNLENAMRGARNPMNSWGRMDSYYDENHNYILGPNDLDLAKRLRCGRSLCPWILRRRSTGGRNTTPTKWPRRPILPAPCTKSTVSPLNWRISAATT